MCSSCAHVCQMTCSQQLRSLSGLPGTTQRGDVDIAAGTRKCRPIRISLKIQGGGAPECQVYPIQVCLNVGLFLEAAHVLEPLGMHKVVQSEQGCNLPAHPVSSTPLVSLVSQTSHAQNWRLGCGRSAERSPFFHNVKHSMVHSNCLPVDLATPRFDAVPLRRA